MESNILKAFIMAGMLINCVYSFNLTVSPDHVSVGIDDEVVNFTFSAGVALTGCQFTWWDAASNEPGKLLDLSRGSESQADPAHLDDGLTGYSYYGQGLGAGDCGITLNVKKQKLWFVACRVRTESGGWQYAWAELDADDFDLFPHNTTTPKEAVVLPGGDVKFAIKADGYVGACSFYLPGVTNVYEDLRFHHGAESPVISGRYRYHGDGQSSGDCGLALTNVSEPDNGLFRGRAASRDLRIAARFFVLIVASPPTAATMSVVYTGNNITAICEVEESRPLAEISWVLGDEVIRQDKNDDSQVGSQDEWRFPWMKGSIKQTLTIQLQPKHNGKDLQCVVSHVALAHPLKEKRTISFTEPTA